MHPEFYNKMQRCVSTYLDEQRPATIVDVGSMQVNGSYRSIFYRPHRSIPKTANEREEYGQTGIGHPGKPKALAQILKS